MTWISKCTGKSGFGASSTAEDVTRNVDGTGLTAIVTGATSGVCFETARVLALRRVRVVIPVINLETGKKVKERITKKIPNAKIDVMELDISSMESVRKFASEFCSKGLPLNILILNGGVMTPPFALVKDDQGLQFASNHIGNFLLTNLLVDTMKNSVTKCGREGRIVMLSSDIHKINDKKSNEAVYGPSKLATALHAQELTRRFIEEHVYVNVDCLHLGVIATNLARQGGFSAFLYGVYNRILKNVPQGAAATCYVAFNPQAKPVSGDYVADCNWNSAQDPELAKKAWEATLSKTNGNY
ncbi:hypothetical protein L2E82_40610 [Cichorium intybus]|uniref:Uncharacterized protein n=1 Tax=Cichorium intybus TaxID=13427 RepID=A0ACB9AMT4_CICIN|nr:hypothetical protein L2E82_40610 [Cichorium intybus]